MVAESAEERFIRGFSLKIEGSGEREGSMVGFMGQEILQQHDTKICFVSQDEGQYASKIRIIEHIEGQSLDA